MKKHAIQLIVISLALLLTACADGDASSSSDSSAFWVFIGLLLVLFIAACVAAQAKDEKAEIDLKSDLKLQMSNQLSNQGDIEQPTEHQRRMAEHQRRMGRPSADTRVMPDNLHIDPDNWYIDAKMRNGIAVDTKNRQVAILQRKVAESFLERLEVAADERPESEVRTVAIPYRDILSSEILEDGETVTKTSRGSQIGSALIGGLAMGGLGAAIGGLAGILGGTAAVVGGLTGSTKSTEKTSKIALMITINDVSNPVHYVMLLDDGSAHKKTSSAYKDAMGDAQKWHGKIKVLIHQADQEDRRQEKETAAKTVAIVPQESLADQLEKLGDLRDRGILTEAEFASQKAKLLASG
ncbi:MAG: SHOCT domain-containing protein [Gammaproteobacteria bacterium]